MYLNFLSLVVGCKREYNVCFGYWDISYISVLCALRLKCTIWIWEIHFEFNILDFFWNTSSPSASSSAPCIASAALFRPLKMGKYIFYSAFDQNFALKLILQPLKPYLLNLFKPQKMCIDVFLSICFNKSTLSHHNDSTLYFFCQII